MRRLWGSFFSQKRNKKGAKCFWFFNNCIWSSSGKLSLLWPKYTWLESWSEPVNKVVCCKPATSWKRDHSTVLALSMLNFSEQLFKKHQSSHHRCSLKLRRKTPSPESYVMLCVMWNLFTVGSLQFCCNSTIASVEANQNRPISF